MKPSIRWALFGSHVFGLALAVGCSGSDFRTATGGNGGTGGANVGVGGAASGGASGLAGGTGNGGSTGSGGSGNAGSASGGAAGALGTGGVVGMGGVVGAGGAVGVGGAAGICTPSCASPTPFCGPNNTCVECLSNLGCTDPGRPNCDPATNKCVQCLSASDCNLLFTTGCNAGTCTCKAGLSPCNGTCVDLKTDPNNCGSCNNGCGSDQICKDTCSCRPGFTLCGGTCTDTSSDPANCGACASAGGTVCSSGQQCNGGVCQATTTGCPADSCSVSGGAVACVNFLTDPANCGGCGNACANDEVCVQGNCRTYSPAFGCNACPCTDACSSLVPGSSCCASSQSVTAPIICVAGGCP